MRLWRWPAGTSAWVGAFLAWWISLTLNGWLTFLPGLLDRLKFTNALVAHAHLAMAGMVTALGMVLLGSLHDPGDSGRTIAGGRHNFILWNGACLLMVAVLFLQGWREGGAPGTLFGSDTLTTVAYSLRLLAGIAMLAASVAWLRQALRKEPAV